MKVLVLDPSGNFEEGKGTTGWALYYSCKLTSVGQVRAHEYDNQELFWQSHLDMIEALNPDVVVIESYTLFFIKKG